MNAEKKEYCERLIRILNNEKIEPTEVKHLFDNISEQDKTLFRKEDLKKINSSNFKNEFPKLFLSDKVTKEGLLERTKYQSDPNELKNILKKITCTAF